MLVINRLIIAFAIFCFVILPAKANVIEEAELLIDKFKVLEATELLEKANIKDFTDVDKADLFLTNAQLKLELDEYQEALKLIEKAEKILTKNKYQKANAKAAILKTYLYLALFEQDKADLYLQKVKDLAESNNENKLWAYYYQLSGVFESAHGRYEKAIESIKKSIVLFEKEKDLRRVVQSKLLMVEPVIMTGDFKSAVDLVTQALTISIQNKFPKEEILSYLSYAAIFNIMGDYNKAIDMSDKAMSIDIEKKTPRIMLNNYNLLANSSILKGNQAAANGYLFEAMKINNKLYSNDTPVLANLMATCAIIDLYNADYKSAVKHQEKVIDIQKKYYPEDSVLFIMPYNFLGRAYMKSEQYDKALDSLNKALVICNKAPGDNLILKASTLNFLGLVYNKLANYDKAINLFNEVLELRLKHFGNDNPIIASSYNNIADTYTLKGNYDKAISFYKKTIGIHEKSSSINNNDLALTYSNIAMVYQQLFMYKEAMEYYDKSLYINMKLYGEDHISVATIYNNMAAVYDLEGNGLKANEYYRKALKIYESTLGKKSAYVATTTGNIGVLYEKSYEYDNAIEYFLQALDIYINLYGDEHPDVAYTYTSLANVYVNKKDYIKAFEYFDKAEKVLQSTLGDNHPKTANLYNFMAMGFEQQKKYSDAIKMYQKAIESAINMDNYLLQVTVYSNIGDLYKSTGQYKEALENYDKAISSLDKLRNYTNKEKDQLNQQKSLKVIYNNPIECALKLNDIELAFNYTERAKAKLLIQSISTKNASYSSGIDKDDLDKLNHYEFIYDKAYNDYMTLLSLNNTEEKRYNDSKLDKLKYNFVKAQDDLIEYRNKMAKKYPAYSKFRYPDSITYTRLAELFKKDKYNNTALIEYFIGDQDIYVFVITKDNIKVKSLDITSSELNKLVKSYIKPFQSVKYASNTEKFIELLEQYDIQKANKLYKCLLEPVIDVIKNKDGTLKDLIIVPDGCLYFLPFETLITTMKSDLTKDENITFSKYKDVNFLLKETAITYLPASSMFDLYFKDINNDMPEKDLVIFSNPDFSYLSKPSDNNQSGTNRSFSFDQLPFAQQEGDKIKLIKKDADLYSGKDATENKFKEIAGKYKNYHFATHGIVNNHDPYLSAIILADNADSENNDGILYAYELPGIILNADMVVLSACDTGLGKVESGEGLFGLSRSFLVAGAKNLVISLWSVNDKSTSELMANFYKDRVSLPPNKALQQAKIKLFNQTSEQHSDLNNISFSHPYFWAPFIILGESQK